MICTWFYTYKPLEEISDAANKEVDLELANEKILSDELNDGKEEEGKLVKRWTDWCLMIYVISLEA